MPEETPQTPETPTAFDVAGASLEDLRTEHDRVVARGQELSASNEPDVADELIELAAQLPVLAAAITERETAAANAQAARDAFASATPATPPAAPAAEPAVEPAAPAAPAAPVSVSQMAAQTPVVPPADTPPARRGVTAHLMPHSAGLLQRGVSEEFAGLNEISETLLRSHQALGKRASGAYGVAQFQRHRNPELVIGPKDSGNETMRKIRQARNEFGMDGGNLRTAVQRQLDKGGSLTAAAGWCAPSENDYELCTNWSAGVGILDLPTVTATRGGINYTDEPTFATIYANAIAAGGGSNLLTEAQVIADTVKTCSEIPCPTFEDRRLDVAALCIRVSFLQAAGFPEVVNAWTDGLLASHEQEINRNIIAQILTRAGAATVFAHPDPEPAGGPGDSFTSSVLAAVELAREDLMYRYMLPRNSTIEVVLPFWVLAQIRADLSRRNGVALLNVSDAEIGSMFTLRGARVQFVRGWQDGLITGGALNATFPGGDAATPFLTSLPSTVDFLAWPAGSVVLTRQDVVTLTNVYDAASLSVNEFTALFAEEGYAPLFPCEGQRLYTVAGCVGGITGANSINCVDETP
ncbi:major capsid protein [Streptomyces sp. NPDC048338]|uniref:major capsid protein n=1 Tax=Streptomyces sp. NPDC048338 TaxID=3365536 RepID=UPI003723C192